MKFIEFKDKYGHVCYLNPSHIRLIRFNSPNEWCVYYGDTSIMVNEEILKKIIIYGEIKIV